MLEIIIVLLLLVLLAEIFSRPRAPRSGVHVISGRMADDYDPPSASLNPRAHT